LIFQIVAENPTWGAPRIHGELLMLGFKILEATISRWMPSAEIAATGTSLANLLAQPSRGYRGHGLL